MHGDDSESEKIRKREVAAEIRSIKEKNAKTLSNIKHLFQKAAGEKERRDAENVKVKDAARQIEETRTELKIIEGKIAQIEKQLEPLEHQLGSPEEIKQQINSLEYALQLNYSPAREKQVSHKVKELNKQLKTLEALVPKLTELKQLEEKFTELKKKLSLLVRELKAHAAKSEEHHASMLSYLKQVDILQTTLPKAFTELDQKRGVLEKLTEGEKLARRKMREEFTAHQQQVKIERDKKISQVKQKAMEIMQRFKQGASISFEELQVLQAAGIEL